MFKDEFRLVRYLGEIIFTGRTINIKFGTVLHKDNRHHTHEISRRVNNICFLWEINSVVKIQLKFDFNSITY